MTDQMMEPWAAWGQMFPRFFKEPLLVANYAVSGAMAAVLLGLIFAFGLGLFTLRDHFRGGGASRAGWRERMRG